jgi:hypothetical protein
MDKEVIKSENKLIKLLDNESALAAVKRDEFLKLVNVNPPLEWIKEHPFARGVKYLPIERIEWLLTRLYQQWKVEVKETKQLMNSLTVTVRVHYRDPIDGWMWQDGVGAVPAKTDKGAKASDMNAILSDAVQTGLPAAKSFAIKDATEHIGNIFGGDLNRKDKLGFVPSYGTPDVLDEIEKKKAEMLEALKDKKHEKDV